MFRPPHGKLTRLTPAPPAAGANFSFAVPAGAVYRLVSLFFAVSTDATVIDRGPAITFDDGTNLYFYSGNTQTIPASTLATCVATTAPNSNESTIHAYYHMNLPPDLWLPPGHRIRSLVANLQGGDTIPAIQAFVEEFIYT